MHVMSPPLRLTRCLARDNLKDTSEQSKRLRSMAANSATRIATHPEPIEHLEDIAKVSNPSMLRWLSLTDNKVKGLSKYSKTLLLEYFKAKEKGVREFNPLCQRIDEFCRSRVK